jgi:hypothetical protein
MAISGSKSNKLIPLLGLFGKKLKIQYHRVPTVYPSAMGCIVIVR